MCVSTFLLRVLSRSARKREVQFWREHPRRVRMSSSTLTAKKNVRDKLKRIHEIIDRADELQYQKVSHSVARNFSNDNDDDDGDNDNKSNANNNLTKLLSQPIKMKDGTIGTPVFVLATCAVEGLDSYTAVSYTHLTLPTKRIV